MINENDQADNEPQSIWVKADVDIDGTYRLAIEYTPDIAVSLDQAGALAYATEIFTAAAYASYDAAVLAQMTRKLDMPLNVAGPLILEMRKDRPPLNNAALGSLRIEPSVSATTRRPFLRCTLVDDPMEWQWSPSDAEQHATHVLQCYPVAHLDNAFRRFLVGVVGIEQPRALNVIDDLANWRTDA